MSGEREGKPERAELKALKMWGVSIPPESPSMKPETGRLSATHAMKVAESQNGVNPMDLFTVFLLSLTCYSLFVICLVKQALRLRKSGRTAACLILIGATINGVGIVFSELNIPSGNNFITVGFSVFLFGFVLLLYRKFREGEIYG